MSRDSSTKISPPVVCSSCKAECDDRNKLKRFNQRHPSMCIARRQADQKRTEINRALAAGTRCVDEEEELSIKWRKKG